MADESQSFIREGITNSGCAAIAGCLWLIAAVLLVLPAILVGLAYGYGAVDYLLLLTFPNDRSENVLWLFRIGLLAVFLGSTAWLIAYFIRKPNDD